VLIEDGILVGYMQDRQNARLMGVAPTGNGRRESFAHIPMPRMTNTYMLGGQDRPGRDPGRPEGRHLCRGLRRRAGGHHQRQVRVFLHRGLPRAERQGRRAGQGRHADRRRATALRQIRAIGNDMALDPGIGNCGKAGQWVPVGVGQPTLMIGGLTVGGSAA
jgi:TldD protein